MLPLHFEARDQSGAPAFVARGQGYNVSVSARGASLALVAGGRRASVSFEVAASAGAGRLAGDLRLPGVVNRYVGGSDRWQPGIETFGRVVAEQVRPGIDVVYYGNQQQLEYDFVIAPGADPADAAMIVTGADRVEIERTTGDLLLSVGGQVLRQRAPIAYQDVLGTRVAVGSAFTYDAASRRVGFRVGQYDHSRALVIDPSSCTRRGSAARARGFIYVLGYSADKAGFPATAGPIQSQRGGTPTGGGLYPVDYFVSKFNPAGSALVYSTLLGGSDDEATWSYTPGAIDVDAQGRVHIVGDTTSSDSR